MRKLCKLNLKVVISAVLYVGGSWWRELIYTCICSIVTLIASSSHACPTLCEADRNECQHNLNRMARVLKQNL